MISLSPDILYEILKNASKSDLKNLVRSVQDWDHIIESVLKTKSKFGAKVSFEKDPKFFFYDEASSGIRPKEEHYADLSDSQKTKLGDLRVVSDSRMSDHFRVGHLDDLNKSVPKFDLQFRTLVVFGYKGFLHELPRAFPVNFEEIKVCCSSVSRIFSIPPTVKKLTLESVNLSQAAELRVSFFLLDHAWETVELFGLNSHLHYGLDVRIVETWMTAKNPQLKKYTCGWRPKGGWNYVLLDLLRLGKQTPDGSIVVGHKKAKKALRIWTAKGQDLVVRGQERIVIESFDL
ncbi:hypothetical protein QR680_007615 [Steinernema hermaphroditum]|uniref:F-box domain-containing protein n=1 Tax=Steinernema hermaphroditum TaxID=289476 RepID=A0AA39M6P3_9BILA|nr:hypothetical protein QR680_007615 [Steinernema hermaphroditum]